MKKALSDEVTRRTRTLFFFNHVQVIMELVPSKNFLRIARPPATHGEAVYNMCLVVQDGIRLEVQVVVSEHGLVNDNGFRLYLLNAGMGSDHAPWLNFHLLSSEPESSIFVEHMPSTEWLQIVLVFLMDVASSLSSSHVRLFVSESDMVQTFSYLLGCGETFYERRSGMLCASSTDNKQIRQQLFLRIRPYALPGWVLENMGVAATVMRQLDQLSGPPTYLNLAFFLRRFAESPAEVKSLLPEALHDPHLLFRSPRPEADVSEVKELIAHQRLDEAAAVLALYPDLLLMLFQPPYLVTTSTVLLKRDFLLNPNLSRARATRAEFAPITVAQVHSATQLIREVLSNDLQRALPPDKFLYTIRLVLSTGAELVTTVRAIPGKGYTTYMFYPYRNEGENVYGEADVECMSFAVHEPRNGEVILDCGSLFLDRTPGDCYPEQLDGRRWLDFYAQLLMDIAHSDSFQDVPNVKQTLLDGSTFPASDQPRELSYLLSYGETYYEREQGMCGADSMEYQTLRTNFFIALREVPLPPDYLDEKSRKVFEFAGVPPTFGGLGRVLLRFGHTPRLNEYEVSQIRVLSTSNLSDLTDKPGEVRVPEFLSLLHNGEFLQAAAMLTETPTLLSIMLDAPYVTDGYSWKMLKVDGKGETVFARPVRDRTPVEGLPREICDFIVMDEDMMEL